MNNNILNITIIFIFTIVTNLAFGNSTTNNINIDVTNSVLDTSKLKKAAMGAFGEIVGQARGGEDNAPDYIRRPKAFPKDFTGYKIELFTVFNKELSLNDELFKKFGGILIEKRTDNSYTYLLGEYKDKAAVEKFLEQVILPKYATAKGVKYKNGEVVKYK